MNECANARMREREMRFPTRINQRDRSRIVHRREIAPSFLPSILPSLLRAITSIAQPSVNAPRASERDTHIDRSRLVEKSARRDPPETCIVVES